MNYEKEAEQLKAGEEWLKLEQGQHNIVILEELDTPIPKTIQLKDGTEKLVEQCDLLVEYGQERKRWSITRARTPSSLWGQLVRLGKAWGTLVGKPITVLVKGTGKNKDYTILEALNLEMKEQKVQ